MRKYWPWGLAALVVVGATVALFMSGLVTVNLGVTAGICEENAEIDAPVRAAVERSALAFADAARGAHPEAAYDVTTAEVKSTIVRATMLGQLSAVAHLLAQAGPNVVAHTYFIQDRGTGTQGRTVCGQMSGDQWVSLAVKPGLDQAHVVIASKSRNNDWAMSVWLLPEGTGWKVQYFNLAISSIAGRTPQALLALAREEHDRGHAFNANMLMVAVKGTIDRGPAFQMGMQQTFQQTAPTIPIATELAGDPPFTWKMDGHDYTVGHVTIFGVDGKLALEFDLPQAAWAGEDDADTRNRAFLSAFIASHRDYSGPFGVLVARAFKPDKSGGYATVYIAGKGFLPKK